MKPDGRSAGGEPFVRLSHRLLDSPAFAATSGDAIKLLLAIWRNHSGVNNGEIAFSVGQAQAVLRCARRRAGEALDELERLRLIECAAPAAMLGRRSRRWLLTEEARPALNGAVVPATYAARKMGAAEVAAAVAGLRHDRTHARGRRTGRDSDSEKNKPRTPVGTDIVPPSEPQNVPIRDEVPLRTPVGTDEAPSGVSLRTPVGTSLRSTRVPGEPRARLRLVVASPESRHDRPATARRKPGPKPKAPPDGVAAAMLKRLVELGVPQHRVGKQLDLSRSFIASVAQGRRRLAPEAQARLRELLAGAEARKAAG